MTTDAGSPDAILAVIAGADVAPRRPRPANDIDTPDDVALAHRDAVRGDTRPIVPTRKVASMAHEHVAKVVEVVGTSDESMERAIATAVARTAETVRNLRWFEVSQMRGEIDGDKIGRFQVMLKIGFAVEE